MVCAGVWRWCSGVCVCVCVRIYLCLSFLTVGLFVCCLCVRVYLYMSFVCMFACAFVHMYVCTYVSYSSAVMSVGPATSCTPLSLSLSPLFRLR